MKSVLMGLSVLFFATQAFSQGSLIPPGAPAPTMKTLAQVEARSPIGGATTITHPGSFYLTGNVTNGGITVVADNVKLDLNGFTVVGSSGNGITVNGAQNVVVRNGSVQGFDICVMVNGASVCRFEKLMVSDSDTLGFYFNGAGGACNGNIVDACTIIGNGERGIHFIGNVGECSFNQVKDCLIGNNNGDGIYFEGQSSGQCSENRVSDSMISGNADSGILFNGTGGNCRGNEISSCRISLNSFGGIRMTSGCNDNQIKNNTIVNNSGSVAGLAVMDNGNLISGNVVKEHTDNYDFADGNQLDLIVSEVPESIDWSASVKLAGSFNSTGNGMTITASDVTVDLGGFTLSGEAANVGIEILGVTNAPLSRICIKNGVLKNFSTGVKLNFVHGSRLDSLIASDNGRGIELYGGYYSGTACNGNTIVNCTVRGNASTGIELIGYGIGGSEGACNGNLIKNCTVAENDGYGIRIRADSGESKGNVMEGCTLENNRFGGIKLHYASGNRIDSNHVYSTGALDPGIQTDHCEGNLIVRNSCFGGVGFSIDFNDTYGPIITSSGALTGTNPWANFAR